MRARAGAPPTLHLAGLCVLARVLADALRGAQPARPTRCWLPACTVPECAVPRASCRVRATRGIVVALGAWSGAFLAQQLADVRWAGAFRPRRGLLLEMPAPAGMPAVGHGLMEVSYTSHYSPAAGGSVSSSRSASSSGSTAGSKGGNGGGEADGGFFPLTYEAVAESQAAGLAASAAAAAAPSTTAQAAAEAQEEDGEVDITFTATTSASGSLLVGSSR